MSPAPPTTPPAAPVLGVRGLRKVIAGHPILDGVCLDLAPGELVAIIGESGVGKSTLLNLIAGLETADGGTITLGGTDIGALDDDARTRLRRHRLGFVFQAFHVLPYLTVIENVMLPAILVGSTRARAHEQAEAMLAAVAMADRARSLATELSGGELQRVAIARALVHGPDLVLADEPTGNLDPDTAGRVLALLRSRLGPGRAAGLMVTHSRTAAAIADRVLLLTASGLAPAPG